MDPEPEPEAEAEPEAEPEPEPEPDFEAEDEPEGEPEGVRIPKPGGRAWPGRHGCETHPAEHLHQAVHKP